MGVWSTAAAAVSAASCFGGLLSSLLGLGRPAIVLLLLDSGALGGFLVVLLVASLALGGLDESSVVGKLDGFLGALLRDGFFC